MVFYDSLAMKTFFVGWCHHYKFLLICTEIIKHVSPRYGISLFIEWMVLTTWLSTEMEITFLCLFINQLLLLSSLLSLSTLVKPDYYMLFLLFYYYFLFFIILYIFLLLLRLVVFIIIILFMCILLNGAASQLKFIFLFLKCLLKSLLLYWEIRKYQIKRATPNLIFLPYLLYEYESHNMVFNLKFKWLFFPPYFPAFIKSGQLVFFFCMSFSV